MPIERIPGADLDFFLIGFGADGRERTDDPAGRMSEIIRDVVVRERVTDVFLLSHGWNGDVLAARDQYIRWTKAMLRCSDDIERVRTRSPGFRPLIVGYHWPSLAWGQEEFGAAAASFAGPGSDSREYLADEYANLLGAGAEIREAVRLIIDHAAWDVAPPTLPHDVVAAYELLDRASGLANGGPGAPPGQDREQFDPEAAYQFALEDDAISFGRYGLGGLLAPLRFLTFWKMKDRARAVGEAGGHELVRALQSAWPETRFHLMGHSFGCIAVSAIAAGPPQGSGLPRPVASMALVQGALSLWSYASAIPNLDGRPGYFWPVIGASCVTGPIIVTSSMHDTAVGRLYPLAAGVARQVAFSPGALPTYGAMGAFGARGPGLKVADLPLRATDHTYGFDQGWIYNLEASEVIREGGGLAGAHSDIDRPELAHAVWEAAFPHSPASQSERVHPVPAAPIPTPSFSSDTTPAESVVTLAQFPASMIVVNGIDGTTGHYLVPPLAQKDAAAIASDPVIRDPSTDAELAEWLKRMAYVIAEPKLGLPYDARPERVEEAGWAVLFPASQAKELNQALAPLLDHRRKQLNGRRFRDDLIYHPGETWQGWLRRNRIASGSVDPDVVPYYILVAGDPSLIPFEFCHLLDVEYAVGRIHFDTLAEYTRYARSVVEYETATTVGNRREVTFFAPRHDFDAATHLSADFLVQPLTKGIPGEPNVPPPAERHGFRTTMICGPSATKEALREVFVPGDQRPPAVLFTASHGIGWPLDHPLQRANGGALLCQDWPALGTVGPEHYFAAADVPDEATPAGMICFNFACFSAGTPARDRFLHKPGEEPPRIADREFVAALPQRLLSHPGGGVLACVGHVDRAWGYSFAPRGIGPQLLPFRNFLGRVLLGEPVGHAMKDFNERHAMLSTALGDKLEWVSFGRHYPDAELAIDWLERNDAKGYLVVGDPAVALRVGDLV